MTFCSDSEEEDVNDYITLFVQWTNFLIDISLTLFVLYDCSLIHYGVPGFGDYKTAPKLFGIVDLQKPSQVLPLRAFVWLLLALTIAKSSEFLSLALGASGFMYFMFALYAGTSRLSECFDIFVVCFVFSFFLLLALSTC